MLVGRHSSGRSIAIMTDPVTRAFKWVAIREDASIIAFGDTIYAETAKKEARLAVASVDGSEYQTGWKWSRERAKPQKDLSDNQNIQS